MDFAQAHARPIPGAVATVGVSQRVAFLRRTYAHLGVALIAWAMLTAYLLLAQTKLSWGLSQWALSGNLRFFVVLAAFMLVGGIANRLARSDTSRAAQYGGLGLAVVAEAVILQPLLWIALIRFGNVRATAANAVPIITGDGGAGDVVLQAAGITLAIFLGLTLTVFVSRKDFSFLRGILTVCSFAALGVIVLSLLFSFSLGVFFIGAMILVMAGYILYQTSQVMAHFPPTHHVAAALMLFSTVATLFWYVLQLLMSLRGND